MNKKNNKLIFPALRHSMGWENDDHYWTTYTTRMTLKDIAGTIITAPEAEIIDPSTNKELRLTMQRGIRWNRVKDIATYLAKRPDRVFPPLVVAIFGAEHDFIQTEVDENLNTSRGSSVGHLYLDDININKDAKFVAIDGQHRLAAIRAVLNVKTHLLRDDNFQPLTDSALKNIRNQYEDIIDPSLPDEEMTVSFLPRPSEEEEDEKIRKYRKVFISINRNAKTTSDAENIIMEEIDPIALTLQNLTEENPFFQQLIEKEKLSMKGTLSQGDPNLMTIKSLYNSIEILLANNTRKPKMKKNFKSIPLAHSDLRQMFHENQVIWEAIVENLDGMNFVSDDNELPDYSELRDHSVLTDANAEKDYLWLWPIGLELMASIISQIIENYADTRLLQNIYIDGDEHQTQKNHNEAKIMLLDVLSVIGKDSGIDWSLASSPWRGFYIQANPNYDGTRKSSAWIMASGNRSTIRPIGERIGGLIFSVGNFSDYPDEEYDPSPLILSWAQNCVFGEDESQGERKQTEDLNKIVTKVRDFMQDRDLFELRKQYIKNAR